MSGSDQQVRPLHQFVYASVTRLPGRQGGGWGTVVASGPVEAVEEFRGWVSTRLSGHPVLPQFPDAADLARRPVRLRVGHRDRLAESATRPWEAGLRGRQPDSGGPVIVLAHSIDAGPDATRRPGNVCSHVAIAEPQAVARPIELWGSPDWLRPFQSEQTESVTLPESLRPGPLDAGYTFRWAASGAGATSLGWMLAAAEHARATGRALLIASRSPEEAAHWIAVVSQLSPRLARLAFSTLEDALSLDAALGLGLRLIGLDAAALPTGLAERPDVLLVDPTWQVRAPEGEGGAWRLPDGRLLPAGPWADIALELLNTDPLTRMRAADDLAELIGRDLVAAAPLYWTSATALLRSPLEDLFEPSDLLRDVLRDAPDGVPEELLDELLDMLAGVEDGATVWRGLDQARSGQVRVTALTRLVEAALAADDPEFAPHVHPEDQPAVAARLRSEVRTALAAGSEAIRRYLRDNGLVPVETGPVVRQGVTTVSGFTERTLGETPRLPDLRLDEIHLPEHVWVPDTTLSAPAPLPDLTQLAAPETVPQTPPVSMTKDPPAEESTPEPALNAGEAGLLRVIAQRAETDLPAAAALAEAALRLAGVFGDRGLASPPPSRYLPFIAWYLLGEARRGQPRREWLQYAAMIWHEAPETATGDLLLSELAAAVVRHCELAAAVPQWLWPALHRRGVHRPPRVTGQTTTDHRDTDQGDSDTGHSDTGQGDSDTGPLDTAQLGTGPARPAGLARPGDPA